MIFNASQSDVSLTPQNHRQPEVVRALRWFWRFSQFYGEYEGRSLQARQHWVTELHAQSPDAKTSDAQTSDAKHQMARHQMARHQTPKS
ncbi:MAG: hypothetical protein AB8B99_13750 [Phormidesmis sp.]